MSPGKGGRGFLLKGTRNQFPELGSQTVYPRDLESTHLPLKASHVEVSSSTEPSALLVGVKDSVPFSKWVDMSWQVSLTPFTFSIIAWNVLGLHMSYCCVCKGCFVRLQSLYCQPLASLASAVGYFEEEQLVWKQVLVSKNVFPFQKYFLSLPS